MAAALDAFTAHLNETRYHGQLQGHYESFFQRANSEGSLSKRTDRLWEARVTLEDGTQRSLYAKTHQEAARKLAEALRDRDKGVLVAGGRQTVGQYLMSWLQVTKPTIRPRT